MMIALVILAGVAAILALRPEIITNELAHELGFAKDEPEEDST